MSSPKLIVALDFESQTTALELVDQLDPKLCAVKVGNEMFTLFGTEFVRILLARQFKIFLDLKFHDIPNTVARACSAAAELGVWMLNVHASGGPKMMCAARNALDIYGKDRPLLIAVTVLTSMDEAELSTIGIKNSLTEHACHLAKLAQNSGLEGIVCSALEVPVIKTACGNDFLAVTPGIRMPNDCQDDQVRIITPKLALQAGSDYLVVGRPITRAAKPQEVVREILGYE